jgi:hypothetical protein
MSTFAFRMRLAAKVDAVFACSFVLMRMENAEAPKGIYQERESCVRREMFGSR